jgi:hypothetical protein
MNKLIPLLAIGYLGAITNLMTDAKSLFGPLAALASFIASCYAIPIARKKLKNLEKDTTIREANDIDGHLNSGGLGKPTSRQNDSTTLPAVLLCTLIFAHGCATDRKGKSPIAKIADLPATILDSAAKLVTTTTTNVVEQAVITQDSGLPENSGLSTQHSELRYVTNFTLVTNMTAITKPAAEKPIAIADTAATFLPPPYGEIAAGILALATAGLTAAVRRRNAMLKTVIDGVERAGVPAVKEEISTASMRDGTAPALHALVQQLTQSK